MPLVKIYYGNHFSEETAVKLNNGIHDSLIQCFQIPKDDTFQLWISMNPKKNFIDECYLLNKGKRNSDFIYIEIFCGPDRTIEQKKELYETIAKEIQKETLITKQNIFILLNEVPTENWSFGAGEAQML